MSPRPPPPGLSATSAKISAGRERSAVRLGQPHRLLQGGQVGVKPVAPLPSGAGDFQRQGLGGVAVGRRHHGGQAVVRRVAVGEAAHHRHVHHPPLPGRLAISFWPRSISSPYGRLGASGAVSMVTDGGTMGSRTRAIGRVAARPSGGAAPAADSAPRSRMSRCGLVR